MRLFDFGHSTDMQMCDEFSLQNVPYAAPEVFFKKPAGLESDWWSYGVVIAELLQGKPDDDDEVERPFDFDEAKLKKAGKYGKPNLEKIKHKKARKFILKLLKTNPKRRLRNVSSHKFFANVQRDPSFKPEDFKFKSKEPTNMNFFYRPVDEADLQKFNIRIPSPAYFSSMVYEEARKPSKPPLETTKM